MHVVSYPFPSRGAFDEGDPTLWQVPRVLADRLALPLLGQARSQDGPSQQTHLRASLPPGPPPSLWHWGTTGRGEGGLLLPALEVREQGKPRALGPEWPLIHWKICPSRKVNQLLGH